ncbi:MAG: hypothetical protein MK193_03100 [Lentisphaeria bacterium]|nr:hypothetical protein [Lentisphaeria bacterium]
MLKGKIKFYCQKCEQKLSVGLDLSATHIICPSCENHIKVPEVIIDTSSVESEVNAPIRPTRSRSIERKALGTDSSSEQLLQSRIDQTSEEKSPEQNKPVFQFAKQMGTSTTQEQHRDHMNTSENKVSENLYKEPSLDNMLDVEKTINIRRRDA